MGHDFRAGQRWAYRAPDGFASSRIVIGAVVAFAGNDPVMCCMVIDAAVRQTNGTVAKTTIPFLPLTCDALEKTVVERDGEAEVDASFIDAYSSWRGDDRGLSVFSVPFEGRLDQLIARQMASIIGVEV